MRGVDLVVLDLGLPDMDGLDVAREIRASGNHVPILILTARTSATTTKTITAKITTSAMLATSSPEFIASFLS